MARPKTKQFKQLICKHLALGVPIQIILDGRKVETEDAVIVAADELTEHRKSPDWPDWEGVVEWLKVDEVFRADYEQARIYGADYLADEMLDLMQMLRVNPRNAPAVKAAMEILKWQTMVRNSKYSERIIQETKNTAPQDPEKVAAEIKRLQAELKIAK